MPMLARVSPWAFWLNVVVILVVAAALGAVYERHRVRHEYRRAFELVGWIIELIDQHSARGEVGARDFARMLTVLGQESRGALMRLLRYSR